MSPMLRSLRQRRRPPFKNVLDRSGRANRIKKGPPASSPGKKLTLTDLSSAPYLFSPSKNSGIDAFTHGKAAGKHTIIAHKKQKISSGSGRMTTRASALASPSILSSPDYSSLSSVVPTSSRSIHRRAQPISDPPSITAFASKEAKQKEILDKPQKCEQRVLRPRGAPRGNLSVLRRGRRPFVEVKLLAGDARTILGRRIKVWWPLDSCWYYGSVKKHDCVKDSYWIVYDDGDEEWLDLQTERCRIQTRPGEVLNGLRFPSNTRNAFSASENLGDEQIRERCDEPLIEKTLELDDDQADPFRIKDVGQDIRYLGDETYDPSELTNQWKVCNGSLHDSASNRDLNANGNCSFRSSCKVKYVYRRRHSRRNEKEHGHKSFSGRESIVLSASENRETSPATRFSNLLAESGCKPSQVTRSSSLIAGNGCSIQQHLETADARQEEKEEVKSFGVGQSGMSSSEVEVEDLTSNGSTCFIPSSLDYRNFAGYGKEPLKSHGAGLCPVICDCDSEQATVNTGHSLNGFRQVVSVSLNQTGNVIEALHSGSSGLVVPLSNIGRPEQIPASADLFIGCTRLACDTLIQFGYNRENDFTFKRFEDNQASSSQLSSEIRKCSENPGRYLCYPLFFLQRIHLNVSNIVHDFFGQGSRLAGSNFYEGVLKRSFISGVRAKALIIKQSACNQLMIDRSFCGDGLYLMLLMLQSSDFSHSFSTEKERDRLDETQQMGLNDVHSELFEFDTRVDLVDFCNKVDWHLSFKRCRLCLVMQSNLSDSYMAGFYCNELSFIAAVPENDDSSQVEFNGRIGSMPLLVKVVSGGSACLASMLNSLQETLHIRMVSNEAVPNHLLCTSRKDSVTNIKLDLVGTRGYFGASTNPHTKGFVAVEKEVYGRSEEIMLPKFSVCEFLRPLLEEIWPSLIGKNGLSLGPSQILYFFLARYAAYILGTSSPSPQFEGKRHPIKTGRSEYLLGAERMSTNMNLQSVSKNSCHAKKRRRSDKTLKQGISPLTKDLVQNATGVDRSAVFQAGSRLGKRRKFDTESSVTKIDKVQDMNNDLDELAFESSTPMLEEKSYIKTRVSQPEALQRLQSSNSTEICVPDSFLLEERKSDDSKQIGSDLGSFGVLPRESLASYHFQESKNDFDSNFSESSKRSISYSNGNEEESVTIMKSRRKRHDFRPELGGAVDDSIQNRRKRQKSGPSSAVHIELDCREELFERNVSFYNSSMGHKGYGALENILFQDSETELLICSANLLSVQNDRGWRELGATVELLLEGNTWVLSISRHGKVLFTHKAEQSVAFGSANKYTHAMMWKGGKSWSLEFEDRRQWLIFKEMHQICFHRNTRVASVRHIPIPGVQYVEESFMADFGHAFVRPEHYLCQKQGELDAALSCSRALYNMDSEDENWVHQENKEFTTIKTGHILNIKEDIFEALIDKLEKAAYLNHQDIFTVDVALELCQGLWPADIIKAVHTYWITKRSKIGMPLIRYFQPAPWERYQRQLQEWQAKVKSIQKDSHLAHQSVSAALPLRPPGFAFCLRPRGLEVPNKVQKQRSQKKLGSAGTMPRHWASAIPLDHTRDDDGIPVDLQHDGDLFVGMKKANFEAFREDHYFGARYSGLGSTQMLTGSKVCPGHGSSFFHDKHLSTNSGLKLLQRSFGGGRQRWNSKKAGRKAKKRRILAVDEDFIPEGRGESSKKLQMLHNLGVSKEIIPQDTNVGSSKSTVLCPLTNLILPSPSKTGDADPVVVNLDSTSVVLPTSDVIVVAMAKAAVARKAADVAASKRAKAQALYAVADVAMRKAVSAMIAAEAIEAEKQASMALIFPDEPSQLGLHSDKHTDIADVVMNPSKELVVSKKKSKLGGNCDPELVMPWQHCAKKTVQGSTNMVLRGSSVKKHLVINTDDTLLPIPSWSQELGAGIGTTLIQRGKVSPQRSLRHSSVLGTTSDCASRCFGVA